ncbi:acyl carrier protein [Nocardia carnea]|uniref:acyl carrier protein n=1 Tax=Nocardia carnea TaxID=37328 RepID=UPI0024561AAC|nr:acyl carrier protein [Nocardia carnea]
MHASGAAYGRRAGPPDAHHRWRSSGPFGGTNAGPAGPADPNSFRSSPMSDRIRDVLNSILEEDLDLSLTDPDRESLLVEDLGIDSVAFAIGVVAIEERLGVKLTEREMAEAASVGDLEDLIRAKSGAVA